MEGDSWLSHRIPSRVVGVRGPRVAMESSFTRAQLQVLREVVCGLYE